MTRAALLLALLSGCGSPTFSRWLEWRDGVMLSDGQAVDAPPRETWRCVGALPCHVDLSRASVWLAATVTTGAQSDTVAIGPGVVGVETGAGDDTIDVLFASDATIDGGEGSDWLGCYGQPRPRVVVGVEQEQCR